MFCYFNQVWKMNLQKSVRTSVTQLARVKWCFFLGICLLVCFSFFVVFGQIDEKVKKR